MLDSVGVQEVGWDRGGTEPVGYYQVKEDEMDRACSTNVLDECIHGFVGKIRRNKTTRKT
jgi:hypothetical protein